MGRKQSWDQAEVLASAMRLFRRRGYLGASVRDLEEATGLHPGSLYRAFKNKDELFSAALDVYNDKVVQARVQTHLRESDDAVAGIRSFFTSAFENGIDPDPGCLLTNTAVESFSVPQALPGVQRGLDLIEAGFTEALTRAGRAEAEVLAVQLLALYQGLLVLVRAGAPATKLHTITESAIASIDTDRKRKR
ncbi:TetR/AcrR family transcriptional regulator [Paenarthrobacter aromaticivorans]|uniref:TetR/AcrR family transcriptional regulator n=1 Tax=Paenarthrobacter aromaticivorans TaxID=2849150 RepID=UPI003A802237